MRCHPALSLSAAAAGFPAPILPPVILSEPPGRVEGSFRSVSRPPPFPHKKIRIAFAMRIYVKRAFALFCHLGKPGIITGCRREASSCNTQNPCRSGDWETDARPRLQTHGTARSSWFVASFLDCWRKYSPFTPEKQEAIPPNHCAFPIKHPRIFCAKYQFCTGRLSVSRKWILPRRKPLSPPGCQRGAGRTAAGYPASQAPRTFFAATHPPSAFSPSIPG